MNKKIIGIFVCTLMITTVFGSIPIVKADKLTIDEEQTSHSQTLQMGYTPSDVTFVKQAFIPDKKNIVKIEIYCPQGTTHSVKAGIAMGTAPYVFLAYAEHPANDGWNTFDFDDITVIPGQVYHVLVYTPSSKHVDLGFEGGNPYGRGVMSYFDHTNTWTYEQDWDMAFKVWGYNSNSRPNKPVIVSPGNGQVFTIPVGETTLDIDLTATATDPDGDEIIYRFWDASSNDILGTSWWMQSGETTIFAWGDLSAGMYSWYVKAADFDGFGEASDTFSFIIEEGSGNNPPNKPITPSGPESGDTGVSYTYTTSATDPDGDNVKYGWDWNGDDIVDEWTGFYASGAACSIDHSWSSAGTYNVKVMAEDVNGAQSNDFSSALTIVITEDPVEYILTMSVDGSGTTSPSVGQHSYEAGSTVSVKAFANSRWSFDHWSGDLSGSTNPETIPMNSDKTVTAHFTDDIAKPLTVDAGGLYVGVKNEPVAFEGTVSGGRSPYTYKWDFGDEKTSSSQSPSHTYSKQGVYTVKFTVTDSNEDKKTSITTASIGQKYDKRYAVILVGYPGGTGDDDVAKFNYLHDITAAYNMYACLKGKYGFNSIYVLVVKRNDLVDDTYWDPALINFHSQLSSVNKEQAKSCIKYDVAGSIDKDDLLFFTYIGHGEKNKLRLNLVQTISDTELEDWMRDAEDGQIIYNIFACYSGSFIDKLSNKKDKINSIVLTSSTADETTRFGIDEDNRWNSWIMSYIEGLQGSADYDGNNDVSIEEAFRYSAIKTTCTKQHPLLDDNGKIPGNQYDSSGYYDPDDQDPQNLLRDGAYSSIITLEYTGSEDESEAISQSYSNLRFVKLMSLLERIIGRNPLLSILTKIIGN